MPFGGAGQARGQLVLRRHVGSGICGNFLTKRVCGSVPNTKSYDWFRCKALQVQSMGFFWGGGGGAGGYVEVYENKETLA